jgi:hypothetical protein
MKSSMAAPPLNEDRVIELTAMTLQKQKHSLLAKCLTSEHGVDLETLAPSGKRWLIEAKGETSARKASRRYGKPFNGNQVSVHVSRAFYQAASLRCQFPNDGVALALPCEPAHQKRIEAISSALSELAIDVIWVRGDGTVDLPAGI